jgi:hypothetical protein
MKKKNYSKIFKRRVIWFEKVAREEENIRQVKEGIDEYFEEGERESAYVMAADMMTLSYPFDADRQPPDLIDVVREKYGLEVGDVYFMDDLLGEKMEETKTRDGPSRKQNETG